MARLLHRASAFGLLGALLVSGLVAVFFFPPSAAYATGPSLQLSGSGGAGWSVASSPTSETISFGSNVNSGEALVVYIALAGGSASTSFAVTDSLSSSYTVVGTLCVSSVGNGEYCSAAAWATATSSGAYTVTVTETGSASGHLYVDAQDWIGMPAPYAVSTSTGYCNSGTQNCPTSMSVSPSLSYPGSAYIVGSIATGTYIACTFTAGGSFTMINQYCPGGSYNGYGDQYSASVSSPTGAPMSVSYTGFAWVETALVIYQLVTQPILVATPSGGSAFTYTVSGCSVSPTSGTSGATATNFVATPNCVLTVTMPTAGANTRYVLSSSASSATVTTCATGTCSTFSPPDYYQLSETFQATANAQTTFDGTGLSVSAWATVAGVVSTSVCAISPAGGVASATCSGWLDYNSGAAFPTLMSGAGSNTQWKCATCLAAAQTTGGNTLNVNYYKQVLNTFQATTNGQGPPAWDSSLSIAVTGTELGISGSTACTLAPSAGTTTAASCSVYTDYGAAATAASSASGSGSNIRWVVSGTYSWTLTSGGNTNAAAYYKQLQNTYTMVPASPTSWDQAYSEPVKGTSLGVQLSTVCTVSLAVGGGSASCVGWPDYGTAAGPPASFNDKTAGSWAAQGSYQFTDTTGGNTHSVSYDDTTGTVTQPIQITVAASGPSATFTLSGCQVSPSSIAADGTAHSITAVNSCAITVTAPTDGATARYRIGASYAASTVVATCSTIGGTCSTASISATEQNLLALSGCISPLLSPASPTADRWYNYGTSSVGVTCNGVWSRSGGTGTRAISYNWNGGTNTPVLTTGTFTAASPTVTQGLTLNVNPTTQYSITLDSGAASALSTCNPAIPGDACWYDSGTTATIDLNGVYGRSGGVGHRLTSWDIDTGAPNTIATASTFAISIGAISISHAIYTTTTTQYYVQPGLGLSLSAPTISGDGAWYDINSQVTATGVYPVTYVVGSPLWVYQFSSIGLQLRTNVSSGSITYGSLVLTFTCAKCSALIFVPSTSGLSVQKVTDDGNSIPFSTQGQIVSFSGSSSWAVYFGQTVGPIYTGGSTTTTSSSSQGSGGIWQNLNADPTWLITIAIAAVAVAATVLVLQSRGHSFKNDLRKLEKLARKGE